MKQTFPNKSIRTSTVRMLFLRSYQTDRKKRQLFADSGQQAVIFSVFGFGTYCFISFQAGGNFT